MNTRAIPQFRKVTKPQTGDIAHHRTLDLDSRPVAEVSLDGQDIRIAIGDCISGWLPARNYRYTREVK